MRLIIFHCKLAKYVASYKVLTSLFPVKTSSRARRIVPSCKSLIISTISYSLPP